MATPKTAASLRRRIDADGRSDIARLAHGSDLARGLLCSKRQTGALEGRP